MRFAVALVLFTTVAYAGAGKKLQSPKATEFNRSLGAPMLRQNIALSAAVLPPPKTNFVYKRTFLWDYPLAELDGIRGFRLYMGESPGSYTIIEDAGTNYNGTNFFYVFLRTNWVERLDRHFAVVTAADPDGLESLPSNEVHWPAYPPDHYRLQWQTNWTTVNIYSFTDLSVPIESWPLIGSVSGTNIFEGLLSARQQFFVIDKPDVLTITVFNPNP